MAKVFVHVTRVKNAMGFEQPITTLTSVSGNGKKNANRKFKVFMEDKKTGSKSTITVQATNAGVAMDKADAQYVRSRFPERAVAAESTDDVISRNSIKNDYICGKCGAKLTREGVLSSDGTCPKCGEPIHMGTAFLNRQKNVRVDLDDVVSFDDPEGRKRTGRVLEVRGTELVVISKGNRFLVDSRDVMKNGARWSTTDIYPQVEGKRKELIKDPSKSLGETLKPGKPGTLANAGLKVGDRVKIVGDPHNRTGNRGKKGIVVAMDEWAPDHPIVKLDGDSFEWAWRPEEVKKLNAMPPDSGFEKEAAIAERRGSSAKNNVHPLDKPINFKVGDYVIGTFGSTNDKQGKVVRFGDSERGVPWAEVKTSDGSTFKEYCLNLKKFTGKNAGTKNADRSRPTDVDTWDDVPGMKNADFEVGDTVTVDKPGNSYNGSVGTVMVLHEGGEYADVRFAGIGTKLVHLNNLKPGGRRKNTEGRKSNPGWLASKDEGKWSKAKEAVKKEYGEIKWPIVTKVFEKMGGKPK